MAAVEAPGFQMGQRVYSVNPEKGPQSGTVKFVGTVEGYQGTWIGVDWDSGQGRHNGTLNGIHYFDTAREQSGSLVRSHTLRPGVSLLEALSLRYRANQLADSEEEDMYIVSVRQTRVAVELVGKAQVEERQRRLEMLRTASLAHAGVCSAGPPGQIQTVAPNITDLDLTGNLLPNWHEVGCICEELPALKILDLSSSRLLLVSNSHVPVLSSLTTLVLNNCAMSWEQVEILKGSLPNIQELSLCGNKLQRFEGRESSNCNGSDGAFVQGFESLRLLNLEDNHFNSWDEIVKLSQLRSLEQLYLSGNSLQHIFYPDMSNLLEDYQWSKDGKTMQVPFASLRCLILARNKILDWLSVDALNCFPALQAVRLSENPLTDPINGTATRYMLIARIGRITSLNSSQVKPRERRDSEIRYVRHVLSTLHSSDTEVVLKSHPRFEKLRILHDIPVETGNAYSTGKTQKMATTLLPLIIMCVASSIGERVPITKKLPSSTTIGRLKAVCESLYKLKATRQRLFFKEQDTPLPVPLEDDMETLAEVGFAPGGTIIVDEVNDL